MSTAERITTLDFESKGIQPRPDYPPKAVGFSIMYPGDRSGKYYAWGHKGGGNNCDHATAKQVIVDLWRSGDSVLFHNGKFDQEVACNEFGVKTLPWDRFHDTLFLTFLYNPRLWSMKLKDVAVELLDLPVNERDEIKEWVVANVPEAKRKPSTWGAYIWLAPAALVGRYANADTRLTKRLFNFLYPIVCKEGMLEAYNRERQLMPVLMRMEQRGLPIAERALRRDIEQWKAEEQRMGLSILRRLKIPKAQHDNWHSDGSYPQGFAFGGNTLADALESSGKVEAFILTDKGNRSTSADNLKDACSDKELAKLLEVHSQITNCITTFGMPWLAVAQRSGGRIFTNFNQVRAPEGGASTGRLSSYPNLQNIIRSDKDARVPQLRNYIVPAKGRILVARDYSQQELRILAHFEEGDLYDKYMDDPTLDAHKTIQTMVEDVTGQAIGRAEIKTLNFLQVYGGGARALVAKLGVDYETANTLRNYHKKALPGVQALQKQIKKLVAMNEPIVTWGGRVYYCEEPHMVQGRMRDFAYKLLNVLIQGSAADCTKQAMINYFDSLTLAQWDESPLELQLHDELMGETEGDPLRMHKRMRDAMAAVDFSIPMLSTGKTGRKSWGTMTKEKI